MKKKYVLIGLIIVVLCIILFLYFSNSNSELEAMLNKKVDLPNNVYIKEEMINNANTTITTNTYKKDNFIYQHIENDDSTKNEDIIWNFDNKKEIIIDNLSKTIYAIEISDDSSPLENIFISFNEEQDKCNYDRKEKINEKDCIKFYLENGDNNRTYFCVGIDDNYVYQKEEGQYYRGEFTPYYKYNYTYSFDVVTDDDIMKFDVSNYDGYTISSNV